MFSCLNTSVPTIFSAEWNTGNPSLYADVLAQSYCSAITNQPSKYFAGVIYAVRKDWNETCLITCASSDLRDQDKTMVNKEFM